MPDASKPPAPWSDEWIDQIVDALPDQNDVIHAVFRAGARAAIEEAAEMAERGRLRALAVSPSAVRVLAEVVEIIRALSGRVENK